MNASWHKLPGELPRRYWVVLVWDPERESHFLGYVDKFGTWMDGQDGIARALKFWPSHWHELPSAPEDS